MKRGGKQKKIFYFWTDYHTFRPTELWFRKSFQIRTNPKTIRKIALILKINGNVFKQHDVLQRTFSNNKPDQLPLKVK